MRKFLLLLLGHLLLRSGVFCLDADSLKEKLKSRSGYSVITVTRDYSPYDTYQLNSEDFSAVLTEADKELNDAARPVFVVLNEYLCSRKTLEYTEFQSLLEVAKDHSKQHPNAIYYINFLHKFKNGISEKELSDLQKYVYPIDDLLVEECDKDIKYSWPIVNSRFC